MNFHTKKVAGSGKIDLTTLISYMYPSLHSFRKGDSED